MMWCAVSGEPQCTLTVRSCFYRRGGVDFGDGLYNIADKGTSMHPPGPAYDAMCSQHNWRQRDSCREECPYKLEITSPPQYAHSVCMDGSMMDPYVPSSILNQGHPLLDKEFEMFLVGDPKRNAGLFPH